MRKSEVIRLLEQIEGDPEVHVYADHGQDYETVWSVYPCKAIIDGREVNAIHPDDEGEYDQHEMEDIVVIEGG